MVLLKMKIKLAQQIQKFPFLPVWLVFLMDLVILGSSFIIAMLTASVFDFDLSLVHVFWAGLMFFLIALLMYLKKTYKGFVRYTETFEIFRFVRVYILSVLLFLSVYFLLQLIPVKVTQSVPWLWIVLSLTASFTLLVLYRLLVKEIFARVKLTKRKVKSVLIFGAGQSGSLVFNLLQNDQRINYKVCGFLDDDLKKSGKYIAGVRIFQGDDLLIELIKKNEVKELIISALKVSNSRKKQLFDICYSYGVSVKLVPALDSWREGKLDVKDLRNINLDELLGRESIQIDQNHLSKSFKDKVVLVSGAGGSIGSELSRQLINYPIKKLILLDVAESALYEIQQELLRIGVSEKLHTILCDIKDRESIFAVFKQFKPHFVFHAAAYKHVPLMESFPKLAIATNVLGTKNLADAAVAYQVSKFVMVSTDKAVNPTNVMGASKRTAEIYVQSLFYHLKKTGAYTPQFITTRFGNVLGSNGSVIPLFVKQIEKGGPVTVTHKDIERYFMTIPEACKLVTEASSMGKGGEIYVFDMGAPVRIYDLAEKMITLSGKIPHQDIKIEISGLRMGEKLYEELIGKFEQIKPTHNEKIHIVESSFENFLQVQHEIEGFLADLSAQVDEDAIVVRLKRLLPEFKSQYSKFAVLDQS